MKQSLENYINYLKDSIKQKKYTREVAMNCGFDIQTKSISNEISIYEEFKDDLENIIYKENKKNEDHQLNEDIPPTTKYFKK